MFLKGECADFPDSWSDRMWGPDDLPNQRTQYELRRAAVRICEACPVRAECLAFGIMVRDQYGIYGGLPLRARRQVLKTAREAGFRFDPNDPNAEQRLARYIRENPEIVAAARERECKRRKTEQRNARRYCNEKGGTVLNAAILLNGEKPVEVTLERIPEQKVVFDSRDMDVHGEFDTIEPLQATGDPYDPFACRFP